MTSESFVRHACLLLRDGDGRGYGDLNCVILEGPLARGGGEVILRQGTFGEALAAALAWVGKGARLIVEINDGYATSKGPTTCA